jgi:uncharacterized membrane protein
MSWFRPRGLLDVTFEVGIVAKGLDGIVEVVAGLLLLLVTPATINHIVIVITRRELSQDPDDVIATHLLRLTSGLTGSAVRFAAAYLLLHGVVKVVLVVALLRTKLWAYPWTIGFLVVFIVYQLCRIALDPAAWLIALTIFDAAVAWLTWREWRKQRLEPLRS